MKTLLISITILLLTGCTDLFNTANITSPNPPSEPIIKQDSITKYVNVLEIMENTDIGSIFPMDSLIIIKNDSVISFKQNYQNANRTEEFSNYILIKSNEKVEIKILDSTFTNVLYSESIKVFAKTPENDHDITFATCSNILYYLVNEKGIYLKTVTKDSKSNKVFWFVKH